MSITGWPRLLRQALRRDRVVVPVVTAVLVLMTYASAAATMRLYDTSADIAQAAELIDSQPAIVALYGRILDVTSTGEVAMAKLTVLYAAFSSVLYILVVRRHTRVEEESGRAELIGSTVVGRDAPLLAAVAEALGLAVLLGMLVALAAVLGGLPAGGSMVFGGFWAGTGFVATGIGAVACQVSTSARTCAGVAAGMVGAEFAVRAVADASDALDRLGWLSPLGWNTRVQAWSHPRVWVLLLYVVVAAVLISVAQRLRGRRDLGSGFMDARPGRASARPGLTGPLPVLVGAQANSLIVYGAAALAMGALFGGIAPHLEGLFAQGTAKEALDRLGGQLLAALLPVFAIVLTPYAVSAVLHAARDEQETRLEILLATAAPRRRWAHAVTAVAVGGLATLLLATGLGLWVGYGVGGGAAPWQAFCAALGWIPAVALVASTAIACYAFGDRYAVLGWAVFGLFVALTLIGDVLELPPWVVRLSPYSAMAPYPAQPWDWTPIWVMTALTVAVLGGAWLRFATRDIG